MPTFVPESKTPKSHIFRDWMGVGSPTFVPESKTDKISKSHIFGGGGGCCPYPQYLCHPPSCQHNIVPLPGLTGTITNVCSVLAILNFLNHIFAGEKRSHCGRISQYGTVVCGNSSHAGRSKYPHLLSFQLCYM